MRKTLLFLICVISFFLSSITYSQNEKPSIDTVIFALQKRNVMIESETQLELHYSRYNCEDVLKSKYSWGDLLVDWEVSKKGSKCLVKRTLKPPKNTTPKKESITSKQEIEYFLLIDGMFCDYHATNAVCNIDNASEVILNLFNQLVYFDYLGINIYKQMTESNGIIEPLKKIDG